MKLAVTLALVDTDRCARIHVTSATTAAKVLKAAKATFGAADGLVLRLRHSQLLLGLLFVFSGTATSARHDRAASSRRREQPRARGPYPAGELDGVRGDCATPGTITYSYVSD